MPVKTSEKINLAHEGRELCLDTSEVIFPSSASPPS